jgi:hypothetical protein
VIVRRLSDELVVYDLDRHEAHCLNPTAALVFEHCDGRRTVEEIAWALGRELDVPADEGLVWLSLERLGKSHLLEERPETPPAIRRYSRRELMRCAGMAAAVVPAVATVLVPTPAAAAVSQCVPDCTGQAVDTPCHFGDPENECAFFSCDGLGNCT